MADDYADDFENYDEDFEPETPAPATAAAAAAATPAPATAAAAGTAAVTAATKTAAGTKSSSSSPSHKSSSKTTQPPAADLAPPKGKSKHQSSAVVKRNYLQSPHSRAKAGSLSSSAPLLFHTPAHLPPSSTAPGCAWRYNRLVLSFRDAGNRYKQKAAAAAEKDPKPAPAPTVVEPPKAVPPSTKPSLKPNFSATSSQKPPPLPAADENAPPPPLPEPRPLASNPALPPSPEIARVKVDLSAAVAASRKQKVC